MKDPTLFIGCFNDGDDGNWFIFVAPAECDRNQALKDYYKKEYDSELPDDEIEGVYPISEVYDHTNDTNKKYQVTVTPVPPPLPTNIIASHGK